MNQIVHCQSWTLLTICRQLAPGNVDRGATHALATFNIYKLALTRHTMPRTFHIHAHTLNTTLHALATSHALGTPEQNVKMRRRPKPTVSRAPSRATLLLTTAVAIRLQDAPAGDVASLPAAGPDFCSFLVPVELPGVFWTMICKEIACAYCCPRHACF